MITQACSRMGLERAAPASNPEIEQLYAGDQRDREGFEKPTPQNWTPIAQRDAQRRRRAHKLLWAGALRTGEDYHRAAMIFQHGETPADFLLAHILATTALSKGHRESRWLAAAALDRYLHSAGQPQVFGTQYEQKDSAPWSQGAYDRDLLPDSLRADHGVPSYAEQLRRVAALNEGKAKP